MQEQLTFRDATVRDASGPAHSACRLALAAAVPAARADRLSRLALSSGYSA